MKRERFEYIFNILRHCDDNNDRACIVRSELDYIRFEICPCWNNDYLIDSSRENKW